MPRRKEPRIPEAVLDQLLASAELALNAEMDHHLVGNESGNSRDGYGQKTVLTDSGHLALDIPRRDRH